MKELLYLLTIVTWSVALGQTDTLKSNEIEYGILNSKSGIIENFESRISILVNHADLNKIPKRLTFIHGRNNRPIYKVKFSVDPFKTSDTIDFSYPGQVFPKDKFYLEYDSRREEYFINSTVHSNKTPYYMDFKFHFNGDTIRSKDYEILNFKNGRIDENTIRIVNFENKREVKIKYNGQTITIDLLKGREIKPIFHGLTILGYIDNFETVEKKGNT